MTPKVQLGKSEKLRNQMCLNVCSQNALVSFLNVTTHNTTSNPFDVCPLPIAVKCQIAQDHFRL
jgi:hypothetical protein